MQVDDFPRIFVTSSNTIKNDRTSSALHFLKRSFERFASKTPHNDSQRVEKTQRLRLYTTNVYFSGVRKMAKVQICFFQIFDKLREMESWIGSTRNELVIQNA